MHVKTVMIAFAATLALAACGTAAQHRSSPPTPKTATRMLGARIGGTCPATYKHSHDPRFTDAGGCTYNGVTLGLATFASIDREKSYVLSAGATGMPVRFVLGSKWMVVLMGGTRADADGVASATGGTEVDGPGA